MRKLLNISSFVALMMSWQYSANAAITTAQPANMKGKAAATISNTPQNALPTAIGSTLAQPSPQHVNNPVTGPATPSSGSVAASQQNPVSKIPQQVGPITWLQQKYRYPSNFDGKQGMTYVDDQTGVFYQAANGKTFAETALSGKIPSNMLQKRPPIYQVPSWLLQRWESNPNDNTWYYLPPSAQSPLSRNLRRAPGGALEAQFVPQPQPTGAIQWSAQGYSYPTYSNYTVYVNDQTGQSYVTGPNNSKFDLENVPLGKRQKRPSM